MEWDVFLIAPFPDRCLLVLFYFSKTKCAEAKCSSKLSFALSVAVTGVNSSKSDTDQVTTLKLQKNVKKELNKLGLKYIAVV